MTERHLRAVLAEAERVAEHYDQVAKAKDSPAHEYLRYAVLRLLEGDANSIPEEVPQLDGVTVGYGRDQAMYDSWGPTSSGGTQYRHRTTVRAFECSTRRTASRTDRIESSVSRRESDKFVAGRRRRAAVPEAGGERESDG